MTMRVLFIPLTGPSHYFPQVPLAWAFRAAGHDVRVATQPSIVPLVTRSGLNAVPVGPDYDFADHAVDLMQLAQKHLGRLPSSVEEAQRIALTLPPEVLADLQDAKWVPQVKATEAMAADLLPFARWWRPDLVVTDPAVLLGPIVAETLGVPLVRNLFGPYIGARVGAPGRGLAVDDWPGNVRLLFAGHDVEVKEDYAARSVDPCPASMQVDNVPNRLPIRYVPYNDTGPQEPWIAQRTVPLRAVVTLGTLTERSVHGSTEFLVQTIVSALSALDAETIVAVKKGYGGALGTLPDRVRVVQDVPLNVLLPTSDLIIHHGGAGSIMTAAFYGVPQVGVTQVPDTTFLSEQMASTGAGVSLRADAADAESVRAAVKTALSGGPRLAAMKLREEILSAPTPAEAVTALEALAG